MSKANSQKEKHSALKRKGNMETVQRIPSGTPKPDVNHAETLRARSLYSIKLRAISYPTLAWV